MADRHIGYGLAGRAQPFLAVGNLGDEEIVPKSFDPGRFGNALNLAETSSPFSGVAQR